MSSLTESFYFYLGRFIARNPYPFIIVPTVFTLISLIGLINFRIEEDYWHLYAPENALTRNEEKMIQPFVRVSGHGYRRIQVLVDAKNQNESLMKISSLNQMIEFNKFIEDDLSLLIGRIIYKYDDLCGQLCPDKNANLLNVLRASLGNPQSPNFVLSYPYAMAIKKQLFLGHSVGKIKSNSREIVTQFGLIILHYAVREDKNANIFESKIRKLCSEFTQYTHLNFQPFSDKIDLEEQTNVALGTLPYLAVTILLLAGFAVATMTSLPAELSQHWESLLGIVSPGMACISAFGLLWIFHFPYTNILIVVPFLVLVIGIDDAFLIFAGWRQSKTEDSVENRLGMALSKAGTSISITSLTDILCFSIGIFSGMPVVRLFGIYTALALTFDFLYQITWFTAVVAIGGKKETEFRSKMDFKNSKIDSKNLFLSLKWNLKRRFFASKVTPYNGSLSTLDSGSLSVSSNENSSRNILEIILKHTLNSPFTKVSIFVIYLFHFTLSLCLCRNVKTEFSLPKLYLETSPLTPVTRKLENFVFQESYVVHFVSKNFPNFDDDTIRQKFLSMIQELETIPYYSAGPKSTKIWLRPYKNFVDFWHKKNAWTSEKIIEFWPNIGDDFQWFYFENGNIKEFLWTISYKNMSKFADLGKLLKKRRQIL